TDPWDVIRKIVEGGPEVIPYRLPTASSTKGTDSTGLWVGGARRSTGTCAAAIAAQASVTATPAATHQPRMIRPFVRTQAPIAAIRNRTQYRRTASPSAGAPQAKVV